MSLANRSARLTLVVAALVAASMLPSSFTDARAQASSLPALPTTFDTTYAAPSGPVITVNSGGNLQTAINNAALGSTIVLQAGATFSGSFTLPVKSGSGWIYIISSALASLPAGTRVGPSSAALMPKIVTSAGGGSAFSTDPGAHHYRLAGLEITTSLTNTSTTQYGLVSVDGGSNQPHDITIDRCYIHGTPGANTRRAVMMHGATVAVIDSYISDIHEVAADSQAIVAWSGTGPLKIVNNELQGAGENVMFGGASPAVQTWVPSDIEFRNNHVMKPTSWHGTSWVLKNLLEFKQGRRVLVEGNIFENCWAEDQGGTALIVTPRSESGGALGVTQDIWVRKNRFINVAQGFGISGHDDTGPSQTAARIAYTDNIVNIECIGCTSLEAGDGKFFQILNGPQDITIEHNTVPNSSTQAFSENSPKAAGFTYRNNIVGDGGNGFAGTGTSPGTGTLNTYYTSWVFTANALWPNSGGTMPAGNFQPGSITAVGFTNLSTRDYTLSGASPYKNAGTDGKDLGADVAAVTLATACAAIGNCSGASSGDITPPTVSMTAPAGGSTIIGTITASATASDDTGVVGVQFKANGTNIGAEDTTAPYSISWNSASVADGNYTITAVARDAAGNAATSAGVSVTVSNSGPVVSAVSASGVTTSAATISWTTNQAANSQVEYGTTTAYGSSTTLDTALVTSHSQPLTGLSLGTLYHYRVKSANAQSQQTTSADFTFTTASQAPTVSLTAPAGGATLTGAATISANATDDVGVLGVQFKANGNNIGAEDTTASYSISWNTASVSDGAYSITAVARDASGNTTTSSPVAVTVANTAPAVSAVGASALTINSATIAWTTNQAADSQVEYGPTTTYGSSTTLDTAMVTSHSQPLTGLSSGTLYHYRVKSRNAQSLLTTSADFTLATVGAPVISSVATSATTSTTATIAWNTDQFSDSQVDYGLTTAYGSSSTLNSSLVMSHSQTLTGLTSNVTYHYRVRSMNTFGLLSVSGDFTFMAVAAPAISAVAASAVTGSTATISWTTDIASDTQVDYGTSTTYGSSTSIVTSAVTSHSQGLTGLANGTLYHYRVKSRSAQGALATSGDFTFTTVPPPSISGIAVSAITGTTATVSWTTNQPADSQVDYGTTTAYGNATTLDSAFTTSHSQGLAGLAAGTLYHYRVRARNSSSLLSTSPDGTFTTIGPASISGVSASSITGSDATINWTTNQSSDSQVEYGPTTAYGASSPLVSTAVTGHTQQLSGLAQATLYHYRVKSKNSVGLLATSGDFTFSTKSPPNINNVKVSNKNHRRATITWTTSAAADSVVEFGTTASYGAISPDDPTLVTGHSRLLDDLTPSTTYHYRVRSTDQDGLTATSGDFTFVTDATPTVSYTVSVSTVAASTGSGAAIAPVAGITCGATCSGSVNSGTSVTFTAVPNPGSRFAGWGGACGGSLLACTVIISADTNVIATFAPATTGDFDGDGFADLVWQNTDGTLARWGMQGNTQTSSSYLTPLVTSAGIDWQIIGPSDTGGEDSGTGGTGLGGFVHPTGGAGAQSAVYLTAQSKIVDLNWNIVATPDFNGDGKADLLWQNAVTGKLAGWLMDGSVKTFGAFLTPDTMDPGAGWSIRTTGDFNGDGKPDIVWQRSATGSLLIWFMNGMTKIGEQALTPGTVSTAWTLVGSGDFDSDGQTDLVWENVATGDVYLWLMNATSMRQELALGRFSGGWVVRAVGDFDGDGRPDLIWQKPTGELAVWFMNGSAIKSSSSLIPGVVDPSWIIVGVK